MFLSELSQARNWSLHDQQDAHELFSFLMDAACQQSVGHTALMASEGLTLFSQFIGPRYEQIAPRCLHRTHSHNSTSSYTIRSQLKTEVFHQHLLVSQVTCRNCDYHSSPVLQPEAYLTVFFDNFSQHPPLANSLKADDSQRSAVLSPRLADCLAKQFSISEHLPDLNCPKCQSSDETGKPLKVGRCQQERWLAHLPPCLVLHIQRSAWLGNQDTHWSLIGFGSKRSDYVQFPYRLNMARYMMSGRSSTPFSSTHRRDASGDFIVQNALSQMHAHQPRTYVLRSVVVHQGELINSGHYVAYRSWRQPDPRNYKRDPVYLRVARRVVRFVFNFFHGIVPRPMSPTSPWVLTSDIHVLRVPCEEVRSSLAYLLFYERELPVSRTERHLPELALKGQLNGSVTSVTSAADDKDLEWDHSVAADKSRSFLAETDDEDDLSGLADVYEDEDSDEPSDFGDEFTGCSKADQIRTYALSASRV